jgi:SAM-dependent methyltransferase
MKNESRKVKNCRICNSHHIKEVFTLKPTPPGDLFLPKNKLDLSSEKYPLILAICIDCGYLHLPYVLDQDISYGNYVYETKTTIGLSKHYDHYAKDIVSFGAIKPSSLVVDLGSNDGTMLRSFQSYGMKALGVEPSEHISNFAIQEQLETINDYFSNNIADTIINKYGKASVITANYMFANIDNVVGFTESAKRLLADDGLFVIQTGYHPEQMKINMFDYIYHEHFSYFTVKVLKQLLEKCELELIHISSHSPKGGSIRVIAQHKGGDRDLDKNVESFIKKEEITKMHDMETYIRFAKDINSLKNELDELLKKIKSSGKNIVGYGATHNTTTLLYHFELGEYLDFLVDDNPAKHGLYSPGHHLRVYPSEKLNEDKPDYVLVLGWQHQDTIINRNKRFLEEGGKFIIPLPELKVLG